MTKLLLLIVFIVLICNSDAACYTKVCKQKYKKSGNANNAFYDLKTYGGDVHPNPTQIIGYNNQYRNTINANVKCSGQYCDRINKYTCSSRGSASCYHVEHIIDKNGNDPRIPKKCNKCKNIPGNMIMAAGSWNMALGGLSKTNYAAAQQEKTDVYGREIMNRAYSSIMECCRGLMEPEWTPPIFSTLELLGADANNTDYDETCDDSENCICDSDSTCGCDCDYDDAMVQLINLSAGSVVVSVTNLLFLIIILIVLVGSSICLCYMCHKTRKNSQQYAKLISEEQTQLANISTAV